MVLFQSKQDRRTSALAPPPPPALRIELGADGDAKTRLHPGRPLPRPGAGTRVPAEAVLLEALSRRLARSLPHAWHEVFGETVSVPVQFEVVDRTLVHAAAAPSAHWDPAAVDWLLQCHRGRLEPADHRDVLMSFGETRDALEMALSLDRVWPDGGWRVGISGGRTVQAVFVAAGITQRIALGRHLTAAAQAARSAQPGWIVICEAVSTRLRSTLADDPRLCVAIEDVHDGRLRLRPATAAQRRARDS
jgi:hypothetical protein